MKTGQLIVVGLFLFNNISSQNLILNGSFENYTTPVNCTGGSGGFDNYSVFPVNHVVDNWYGYYTTDFFTSVCSGSNSNGSPINLFGDSYPKNGSNYIGVALYQKGNETKEYIYQNLNTSLQAGKNYCLSFFVKRSERCTYAIKNIEIFFSNNSVSTGTLGYINALPQITKQNIFISDTINWVQIQGCFTAIGGEQYITIGNFNSNANTDTLFMGTNNPIPSYGDFSHYYVDDITLINQSTVGIKDMSNELGVISVYPNPANDVLNIDIGTVKENAQVKIYNALGEFLLTESLTTQNSSLKTYNLLSGIYFYHILVGDKIIKTDKIVIIQ